MEATMSTIVTSNCVVTLPDQRFILSREPNEAASLGHNPNANPISFHIERIERNEMRSVRHDAPLTRYCETHHRTAKNRGYSRIMGSNR